MARNNLRTIKLKIRVLKNKILWCFCKIKSKLSNKKIIDSELIIPDSDLKNILILAPHADDEWIGCSQVISKAEESTVYYYNFLGKNYHQENETIRQNEIKNVSKKTGFKLIVSTNRENHSDLKELILENNFTAIFIPFPLDWHPEHIKVNDIALEILKKIDLSVPLYFYHISVPTPESMRNCYYLPLSKKEIQTKIKIFDDCYISQKNTPIRRFAIQNVIWSQSQNFYAAEVFAKCSLLEWELFLNFVKEQKNEIEKSIYLIDYPFKIREYSDKIFLKFNT